MSDKQNRTWLTALWDSGEIQRKDFATRFINMYKALMS